MSHPGTPLECPARYDVASQISPRVKVLGFASRSFLG